MKGLCVGAVESALAVADSVDIVEDRLVVGGVLVYRVGIIVGKEEAADVTGPVVNDVVGCKVMTNVLVCVTIMPPWPP